LAELEEKINRFNKQIEEFTNAAHAPIVDTNTAPNALENELTDKLQIVDESVNWLMASVDYDQYLQRKL
jgi:hypothetical protein